MIGSAGMLWAQESGGTPVMAANAQLFPSNLHETAPKEKQLEYLTSFGKAIGQNMRSQFVTLDLNEEERAIFAQAVMAGMTKEEKIAPPSPEIFAYLRGRDGAWAEKNAKFLEKKAEEKGVQKTESGLLYEILTPGKGTLPKADSLVTVKYVGTFTNGVVFDSTDRLDEGQVEFGLNGVIPGWTEGLQKIAKGGKIKLYVPHSLGYGEQGSRDVPPMSALVFEVELLDVREAPKQATAVTDPIPAPEKKEEK